MLVLCLLPVRALPCDPGVAYSRVLEFNQGAFELVMNLNRPGKEDPDRDPRRNGLYRKGSKQALWTLDRHLPLGDVVSLSTDGLRMVVIPHWAHDLDDAAVIFYRSGKPVRIYSIKSLLTTSEGMPHGADCGPDFTWRDWRVGGVDEAAGRLLLQTTTGDIHEFDLASGELLRSDKTPERQLDTDRIVDFGPGWKTILLNRPMETLDMRLPAGTQVRIRLPGSDSRYYGYPPTRTLQHALLHEPIDFRGVALAAGTVIEYTHVVGERPPGVEKHYLGDRVRSIRHPRKWMFGPIEVQGGVTLPEPEAGWQPIYCRAGNNDDASVCRYGKAGMESAVFFPDPILHLASLSPRRGEHFEITIHNQVLQTTDPVQFWRTGHPAILFLNDRQVVQGHPSRGELRFWPDGRLQSRQVPAEDIAYDEKRDEQLLCHDGKPATSILSLIGKDWLSACDDGSIVYARKDFVCKHPDMLRKQLSSLRQRPAGNLSECDSRSDPYDSLVQTVSAPFDNGKPVVLHSVIFFDHGESRN